jgi:hypothetical protein
VLVVKVPFSAGSFRKRTLEKRVLRTEDFHTGDLRRSLREEHFPQYKRGVRATITDKSNRVLSCLQLSWLSYSVSTKSQIFLKEAYRAARTQRRPITKLSVIATTEMATASFPSRFDHVLCLRANGQCVRYHISIGDAGHGVPALYGMHQQ